MTFMILFHVSFGFGRGNTPDRFCEAISSFSTLKVDFFLLISVLSLPLVFLTLCGLIIIIFV